jgi:deazaflavin-dependent oxidoreductase (nitroreductase family)
MAGTSFFIKMGTGAFISIFRLTGGRLGGRIGAKKLLLLTTTGRKTNLKRTVALGYSVDGDNYVIITYNLGRPQKPGWWFNLKANPRAVIEVGKDKIEVTAEPPDPEQKKRYLTRVPPRYQWYDHEVLVLHPLK